MLVQAFLLGRRHLEGLVLRWRLGIRILFSDFSMAVPDSAIDGGDAEASEVATVLIEMHGPVPELAVAVDIDDMRLPQIAAGRGDLEV